MSKLDYLLLSEYIINECTKKFYSDYHEYKVPFSYIEFYFDLIYRYSSRFNQNLFSFYDRFNSTNNSVSYLVGVFTNTFTRSTYIQNIQGHGKHLVMVKKYFPLSISFDNEQKYKLRETLVILKDIIEMIFYNEEDKSLKSQYIEYITIKYGLGKPSKIAYMLSVDKKNDNSKSPVEDPRYKQHKEEDEVKKGKTKITKVIIPHISLPFTYPVSYTKSRVDSKHVASNFLDSIRMIEILNKHRIIKAKYNQGFITKRNTLIKPKPKKFSDFF